MASLDTLPTEIIRIIIEQFDRCRDVFACMRLCRRLFLIARQFLFHNIRPLLHRIAYWAIQANQIGTLKAVLKAGAIVTTPMLVHHRRVALGKAEPPAVFYAQWPPRQLSTHGPPPYTSRYSTLHLAVREGRLDVLKVLLRHGHPIDAAASHFCCVPWRSDNRPPLPWHDWFKYHLTPLHSALCFGRSEIAQFLIESGASILGREFAYQAPLIPGGPVRTGATALHLACGCGDLPTTKFILKKGYIKKIDVQDNRGYSPLWYAFIQGKWDCFEWLLTQGANINLCVPRLPSGGPLLPSRPFAVDYYTSLLDYAIFCARFEDARKLIKAGIDVHTTVSRFRTPLHECCTEFAGHPERLNLIMQLLDSNLGINARICEGYTPLLSAVSARDINGTRLFIMRGADVDLQLDDGTTAIWLACSLRAKKSKSRKKHRYHLRGASPDIVRLLLEGGARIDEPQPRGQSLLQRVCMAFRTPEKASIVRLLVQHTKNFDSDIELMQDLVYSCLATGDDGSLKAILERIVSPKLWTSKDDLLHLLAVVKARPNLACLEYLLSIDTEYYIISEPGTILNMLAPGIPHRGVYEGMALLLLRCGAHQNFRRNPRTIMLHLAVTHGFTAMARWLIDKGVDVGHRDAANNSALAYAEKEGTIDLLLERGANPWDGFSHSERNLEDTPIGIAITTNNSGKLEKLLSSCTSPPPCAIYDMIECALILGAGDCVKKLQELCPAHVEFLLSRNAAIYLLKMLVRFCRQSDPPQFDEVYKGNLADSVVDTMSLLLEASPLIDLEAKMQARMPLVDTSIVGIIQDILAEDRVQDPDARLRHFRDFRKRVSLYWTVAEPEIIISSPSSGSSSSSSGSTIYDPVRATTSLPPPPGLSSMSATRIVRSGVYSSSPLSASSRSTTSGSDRANAESESDASVESDTSSGSGSSVGSADD